MKQKAAEVEGHRARIGQDLEEPPAGVRPERVVVGRSGPRGPTGRLVVPEPGTDSVTPRQAPGA